MSGKQCRPRCDTAFCGISSGSTLFAQACRSKNSDSNPERQDLTKYSLNTNQISIKNCRTDNLLALISQTLSTDNIHFWWIKNKTTFGLNADGATTGFSPLIILFTGQNFGTNMYHIPKLNQISDKVRK